MKEILGKKLGMTQIFTPAGVMIPVTVVEAGPCVVIQKKTKDIDGYDAVVAGFGDIRESLVNKPKKGAFKKAGVAPKRYVKELHGLDDRDVGASITCDIFKAGEFVDVSGLTKGRGFTGVIQRWNAARLRMSHGTGPVHREVGSMGANSTPSRVLKGKKMAGQYGHERVTIQNLEIVKVDTGRNVLLIKGGVPGPDGGLLKIKTTVK